MAGASVSALRLEPSRRTTRRAQITREIVGERGVGEILDAGLELLVQNFAACVGFAALIWIPFQLLSSTVLSSGVSVEWQLFTTGLTVVPEFLTTGFVCTFAGTVLLGRHPSFVEALRNGVAASAGVLVLALLQHVGELLFLCCFVPGLLSMWLLSITPVVYVLERRDLVDARAPSSSWLVRWPLGLALSFARGCRLVLGFPALLRWAGWALVGWATILLPLSGMRWAMQNPATRDFLERELTLQGGPVELVMVLVSAGFVGIAGAYLAMLKLVYYFDLRVRKEGLDLELALDRLDARQALTR